MTQFAPRKRIITHADLKALQQHADFSLLLQFVAQLNDSCQGVKALAIPSPDYDSPLDKVLQLFDRLQKELDSQPQSQSTDSNGRFGSPMYRTWFDQMTQLVWQCFSNQSESAALELCTYLSASFGDRQRIDYGSGHELNFVCFLFCLNVYCFDESEDKARFQQMVLVVFKR